MSNSNISLDPDQAAASANLLGRNQTDAVALAGQVDTHGVAIGPAAGFKTSLDNWVTDAKVALDEIRADLAKVQEQLNATVIGLAEQDASLAAETATYAAAVEAVPAPPATPAATTPTTADSVPHGAGTTKQAMG